MIKDELMIVKEDNILLFFEEYLRGEGIHTSRACYYGNDPVVSV